MEVTLALVKRATHVPLVRPATSVGTHIEPAAHTFPGEPQLVGSFAKFVQYDRAPGIELWIHAARMSTAYVTPALHL
jgi:hypothetical protein